MFAQGSVYRCLQTSVRCPASRQSRKGCVWNETEIKDGNGSSYLRSLCSRAALCEQRELIFKVGTEFGGERVGAENSKVLTKVNDLEITESAFENAKMAYELFGAKLSDEDGKARGGSDHRAL